MEQQEAISAFELPSENINTRKKGNGEELRSNKAIQTTTLIFKKIVL